MDKIPNLFELNSHQSAITLANAAHLAGQVITEIMGNEISSHLNSEKLKQDTVYMLAIARYQHLLQS